ncbi:methyltransferase-like protein 7A [Bradysia coprophila]|uniref:methyltransferase-like protein 7A n=1 Tax=Bradysia coprophila TaxID=38358 RepID=UPI00187DC35C|nr:methyltransferase-like protein 7A [Bradysia coprophila]
MSKKPRQSHNSKSKSFFNILAAIISSVRSFIFALSYPKAAELSYIATITPTKQELFADIDTITPSDKNQIKILEIGVGPGYNLDFYPKQCRLIALDKNRYFEDILRKNLQKHPGIILEKFVTECAENMTSIPSNSVDVVVSSNVHCSVDNSQSVLKEIRRVLIPGGRYYFFEHGLDEPHTSRYKWQKFVNKTRLWALAWHGCIFTDFEPELSKFGLFKYKGKRYTIPNQSMVNFPVFLVSSHYVGCGINEK